MTAANVPTDAARIVILRNACTRLMSDLTAANAKATRLQQACADLADENARLRHHLARHVDAVTDDTPVQDLGLTAWAANCLLRAGIDTVGQLASYTPEELGDIRNLGPKSVEGICRALARHARQLADPGDRS